MIAANAYRIRFATADDADSLKGLAGGQEPLVGRVIIGFVDGDPAAALSLHDDRVVTDSSPKSDRVVMALRMRAGAIEAFEATPSLRERLLAALPTERGRSNVVQMPVTSHDYDESEPMRAFG